METRDADFEARLKRLEDIVAQLEDADLPLEKGVDLFKEGAELAKTCRRQLEQAKNQVQVYVKGVLEDFEMEPPQADAQGEVDAGTPEDL